MRSIVKSVLACLMVSGVAHAQDSGALNNTEFFFQPSPGVLTVTPQASYLSSTLKATAAGGSAEITSSGLSNLGAQVGYGLTDMFAVTGELGYQSLTSDPSNSKTSGLLDPQVSLRGTLPMEMFNLRFGATADLGFTKNTSNSVTNESNAGSGGLGLTPYVGADMNVGPGILGAQLSYAVPFERTRETTGVGGATSETKSTGGNVLTATAFYELMLADALLGGSFSYANTGEVTSTPASGTATKSDPYSMMALGLYSRIPMGTVELLPSFTYAWLSGDQGPGGLKLDKFNTMTFTAAARWSF